MIYRVTMRGGKQVLVEASGWYVDGGALLFTEFFNDVLIAYGPAAWLSVEEEES